MVTVRQLIDYLDRLSPLQLQAIELLDQVTTTELDDQLKLDVASVLALSPDIEVALQQAEQISTCSQRIVQQCLTLTPIPLPKAPLGF